MFVKKKITRILRMRYPYDPKILQITKRIFGTFQPRPPFSKWGTNQTWFINPGTVLISVIVYVLHSFIILQISACKHKNYVKTIFIENLVLNTFY